MYSFGCVSVSYSSTISPYIFLVQVRDKRTTHEVRQFPVAAIIKTSIPERVVFISNVDECRTCLECIQFCPYITFSAVLRLLGVGRIVFAVVQVVAHMCGSTRVPSRRMERETIHALHHITCNVPFHPPIDGEYNP